MTTAQIHYFLVAAERLNFTAAAEQLFITQPSLSRQISAIEDELGVKLFTRTNNIVRLTQAGITLYQRLNVFYQDYLSIVKEVRDISSGINGNLNLGILEDQYMPDQLTAAIRQLLELYPGSEINILRRDNRFLFAGLQDGTLDAGLMLVYDEFHDYGFDSLPLLSKPAVLAINKNLPEAQAERLTMAEMNDLLERLPLAMVTPDQFPETLQDPLMGNMPFMGLRDTCQIKLLPAISSVSLYVASGLAVTLTNQGNLLANDPNIKFLPVDNMESMVQGIVWKKNSQNALLMRLKELLSESVCAQE